MKTDFGLEVSARIYHIVMGDRDITEIDATNPIDKVAWNLSHNALRSDKQSYLLMIEKGCVTDAHQTKIDRDWLVLLAIKKIQRFAKTQVKQWLTPLITANYQSYTGDGLTALWIERWAYEFGVIDDFPLHRNLNQAIDLSLLDQLYWTQYNNYSGLLMWFFNHLDGIKKRAFEIKQRNITDQAKKETSFPIWSFWAQGISQAPDLVKKVVYLNQIKADERNQAYRVLDNQTICDYLDMPEGVRNYQNNQNISPTHFSEWLRLALVVKYGGCWIDATVAVTDRGFDLLQSIESKKESDFFISDNRPSFFNAYLFMSQPNHHLLLLMQACLEIYMSEFDDFSHYFMIDQLFYIMTRFTDDSEIQRLMATEQKVEKLQKSYIKHITKGYPLQGYRQTFKHMSDNCFNKLSYKYDDVGSGTFLASVIQQIDYEIGQYQA
ncbi:capsular polysaccharide synthesis protein [Lactococcus insecticola]|uniref:Uncharacterized protein n=1 Tax=Pseudolactococcus insecticola TaxID=2709158 RepID=A0A6A0B6E4_9LACT|nr:capsular polysaccharide synthesis protein [Lactococcus insecticola]GFH40305.1 hypothetical protein Hs20B_07030 [Lactococcus insecticola]